MVSAGGQPPSSSACSRGVDPEHRADKHTPECVHSRGQRTQLWAEDPRSWQGRQEEGVPSGPSQMAVTWGLGGMDREADNSKIVSGRIVWQWEGGRSQKM